MTEWPFDPAAVAVGAIDDDQHAAVADALRRDPAFAAEVADYQRLVAQLESLPGVAWDPIPPPPLDVGAITPRDVDRARRASPLGEPPHAPGAARRRSSRGARRRRRCGAHGRPAVTTSPRRGPCSWTPLADEPPTVEAQVSLPLGRSDEVRVRVSGGTPTPDGFVEELWLMNSATDLISLGTFRIAADGTADATFTTAADVGAFDYVDASREPSDGNPDTPGRRSCVPRRCADARSSARPHGRTTRRPWPSAARTGGAR